MSRIPSAIAAPLSVAATRLMEVAGTGMTTIGGMMIIRSGVRARVQH